MELELVKIGTTGEAGAEKGFVITKYTGPLKAIAYWDLVRKALTEKLGYDVTVSHKSGDATGDVFSWKRKR